MGPALIQFSPLRGFRPDAMIYYPGSIAVCLLAAAYDATKAIGGVLTCCQAYTPLGM